VILTGTVKNNVVILDRGASLPDVARVEVHIIEPAKDRADAFRQILQNPTSHYVGWDELLAEEKEEREQRHTL
jgi:hypothetical protein